VLIDGRSVYTPLFSGVFWDVQDTLIADIDRIEVISGPGGTLWGSNAVNGVINIITRNSRDTLGGLTSIGGGPDDTGASIRYGAKLGEETTYRAYAKGFGRENTETSNGASARDSWGKGQLGFRMDWTRAGDALMFDGAGYNGSIDQRGNDDKSISGAHLLGRWNRTLQDQSAIQLQAYYDLTKRVYPGTFGEVLQTFDIDAQHRFSLGARHDIASRTTTWTTSRFSRFCRRGEICTLPICSFRTRFHSPSVSNLRSERSWNTTATPDLKSSPTRASRGTCANMDCCGHPSRAPYGHPHVWIASFLLRRARPFCLPAAPISSLRH
jgi:outer membrane cobalamin receptor